MTTVKITRKYVKRQQWEQRLFLLFTQTISECNITGTAKIWLFYQTYSGGLGFIHLIFTQNTQNHAINLFWQKGEFQDVELRPGELRSAPDSIKLCNRQLSDEYTYYMSPNTNVTRTCDWATANLNLICRGLFCVLWFQEIDIYSFCWYWWNCWPSMFLFIIY
jgi:hypothetical protein